MYCTNCGQQNAETAVFCTHCGAPMAVPSAAENPMPQQPYASVPGYPPPLASYARKTHTGLIVGLSIGGAVVIAAVVWIVLLLTGGTSVEGVWLSEKNTEVIVFDDGDDVTIYTVLGEIDGSYEYDRQDGEGEIRTDEEDYDFVVEKNVLIIGDDRGYIRVSDDFDIDDFIAEAAPEPTPTPEPTSVPTADPTPVPTPALETVTDQQLTLSFTFGERTGTYTGEVLDGLPHGEGTFSTENEDGTAWYYEGEWQQGHFSGQGSSVWEDGFIRSGQYRNDNVNGEGKEYWGGVLRYEGSFSENVYNGQGTFYNYHGDVIYTGLFVDGFISETAADRATRINAFAAQCGEYSWQELYDYADAQTDVNAVVTGQVLQVYEYDEPYYCDFLIYEQGVQETNRIVQVFYRLSEGEPMVEEGQMVTVWGTTEYIYSYTSYEDEYLSVPLIEAWAAETAE